MKQQIISLLERAKENGTTIGDVLAEARGIPEGWLPIETAPKNGAEIWAYNGEQVRMKWIEGECYALWIWADDLLSDADPNPEQPTHWQPLPAAPGVPPASAQDDAKDELQGQPLKLVHLAAAARGAVRFITGRKLPDGIESCELYAMPDYGRAPAELYTAPNADDAPPRFTISASDRFELTGAVGLLRGYGCAGAADALQRTLDAEMASFSVQGEEAAGDARDAERYRWLTEDHADPGVRKHRNDILRRMSVMSHSAASADIDAAIAAQQGEGGGV